VARLLSEADVERLLDPDTLIAGLRAAFVELSEGRVAQPLRSVLPFGPGKAHAGPNPPGLLFLKPAQIGDALATKLITLVPANATRGRPTLIATVLLMSPDTGEVLAIIEANALTALRTAAATAVAVDALAAPEAGVVGFLGSGVLARTHAALLRRVRRVREIRVWSRDPENIRQCAADIGGVGVDSAEQAVRGADIVCTLSNASEPILMGRWLKPGAFVAAVGAPRPSWRELDDEAMQHPVIADQREAALSESGDVILSGATVVAELGEILSGRASRPTPSQTVIFKSLGLAIEDAVAARLVYDAAQSEDMGRA
jgi:ornithine cyclodeaminase/alanine dehydrogenase-like protein (mu-crystallin family)